MSDWEVVADAPAASEWSVVPDAAPAIPQHEAYASPRPAPEPGVLDRLGAGLSRIGQAAVSAYGAGKDIIAHNASEVARIASKPREYVQELADHPAATLLPGIFGNRQAQTSQFVRGVDDLVTLGYGQRLADAANRGLGRETAEQQHMVQLHNAEVAPGYREAGQLVGMVSPGAANAIGRAGGGLVGGVTGKLAPKSLLGSAALGTAKGLAGYELAAPVTAGLSADAAGHRLETMREVATDPAGVAIAGLTGGAGGVATNVAQKAPARVKARIEENVARGEAGGKANKRTADKLHAKAEQGALDETMRRHPDLEKTLATKAASEPGKAAEKVTARLDDLDEQKAPFYEGIDKADAAAKRGVANARAAELFQKADEAQARAAKLRAELGGDRDLLEAAREIDAPAAEPLGLFEAARQIDAPMSGKAAREAGRADFEAGQKASAAKRADIEAQIEAAEKAARNARRIAQRIDARAGKEPGGIDISGMDGRLAKLQEQMVKDGHAVGADAVARSRRQLARLYGDGEAVPAGTTIPARSVRNLANELGEAAFSKDPNVTPGTRTQAQRQIYGVVTTEIEKAAARAGLNVDKLRAINRDTSTLITVRDALKDRASKAASGGTSIGNLLLGHSIFGAGVGGGFAHGGVTGGVTGALTGLALERAIAAARPLGRRLDLSLARRTRELGAPNSAAFAGARTAGLDYAARVSEAMRKGASLQEAVDAADEE